ncbi:MAG: hypothetical protein RIT25_2292, partial [Planctomycetota bacterium]
SSFRRQARQDRPPDHARRRGHRPRRRAHGQPADALVHGAPPRPHGRARDERARDGRGRTGRLDAGRQGCQPPRRPLARDRQARSRRHRGEDPLHGHRRDRGHRPRPAVPRRGPRRDAAAAGTGRRFARGHGPAGAPVPRPAAAGGVPRRRGPRTRRRAERGLARRPRLPRRGRARGRRGRGDGDGRGATRSTTRSAAATHRVPRSNAPTRR